MFDGSLLYFQSPPPPTTFRFLQSQALLSPSLPIPSAHLTVSPYYSLILTANQSLFPFLQPIRHSLSTPFPHSVPLLLYSPFLQPIMLCLPS